MDERYNRNRIYLNKEEQDIIKNTSILLGGCGIGSVIAECALRLGFENIIIVDGDQIELSNLNRQNYTHNDLKKYKSEVLKDRLIAINPEADIIVYNEFINKDNLHTIVQKADIAINALDFSSEIPLLFDKVCQKKGITVLHPYNLGWASLVTIITPDSLSLDFINKNDGVFTELNVIEYVTSYMKYWGTPKYWIEDVIEAYKNEKEKISPPQLAIASWLIASMCTHLLFKIAIGKRVKVFPEFYFSSIENN